jgi:hypothetical protein
VIEMRVRQRDRLQLETKPFERLDDALGFVAGVDADCLSRCFTANNARVLLKSRDR